MFEGVDDDDADDADSESCKSDIDELELPTTGNGTTEYEMLFPFDLHDESCELEEELFEKGEKPRLEDEIESETESESDNETESDRETESETANKTGKEEL